MAVKIVPILVLISVRLGNTQWLLDLECQPAFGVVGENTTILCSFNALFEGDVNVIISVVVIKKIGQKDPVLYISKPDNIFEGDPRVQLPSRTDPSLLFTNTSVSDEGEYEYMLLTNRGVIKDGRFSLRVTGSEAHHLPVITSLSENTEDGGGAELHCSTSGGYPAGTIHWFDNTGANWTERATLEIMGAGDKLLIMSSKLTLTSTEFRLKCFRCVVLKSSSSEESSFCPQSNNTDFYVKAVLVGVGVLVVIIMGLVIIFLYLRKRNRPCCGRDIEADAEADPTEFHLNEEKEEEEKC